MVPFVLKQSTFLTVSFLFLQTLAQYRRYRILYPYRPITSNSIQENFFIELPFHTVT